MSISEQKQIDTIVSWSFKGIFALLGAMITIIFYSMWNGQILIRDKQEIMNNRLIRVESEQQFTKNIITEQGQTMREIQRTINKR